MDDEHPPRLVSRRAAGSRRPPGPRPRARAISMTDRPHLLAAGGSDQGLLRDQNEDRWLVDATRGVFCVVDGVGGHPGGERASEIAVETLRARLTRETGNPRGAPSRGHRARQQRDPRRDAGGVGGRDGVRPDRRGRQGRSGHDRPRRRSPVSTKCVSARSPRSLAIIHRSANARTRARFLNEMRCAIPGATRCIATSARSLTHRTMGSWTSTSPVRSVTAALLLCSDGLSDLVERSSATLTWSTSTRADRRRRPRLDRRRQCCGRQGQRHGRPRLRHRVWNVPTGTTTGPWRRESLGHVGPRRRLWPRRSRRRRHGHETGDLESAAGGCRRGRARCAARVAGGAGPGRRRRDHYRRASEGGAGRLHPARLRRVPAKPSSSGAQCASKARIRRYAAAPWCGARLDGRSHPRCERRDASRVHHLRRGRTALARGVRVENGAVTLTDVRVSRARDAGIDVGPGAHVTIRASVLLDNAGSAIVVASGAELNLRDSLVLRNGTAAAAVRPAIELGPGARATIAGNAFGDNAGPAVSGESGQPGCPARQQHRSPHSTPGGAAAPGRQPPNGTPPAMMVHDDREFGGYRRSGVSGAAEWARCTWPVRSMVARSPSS